MVVLTLTLKLYARHTMALSRTWSPPDEGEAEWWEAEAVRSYFHFCLHKNHAYCG